MRIMKEYLGLFAQEHGADLRTLRVPGEAKAEVYLMPFKAVKYSTIVATSSGAIGAL
jgi:hypothetical protein